MSEKIDLAALFGQIAAKMEQDRQQLNDLDGNSNAGDNMARNFALVSEVLSQQREASPQEALAQAATALREQGQGRTASVYAQGLEQAAQEYASRGGQGSAGSVLDLLPLLQGLLGGAQQAGAPQGQGTLIDALIPGALAYLQAKRQGASETEALLQALNAARQSSAASGAASPAATPQASPQAPATADPGAVGVGSLLEGLLQGLAGASGLGQITGKR